MSRVSHRRIGSWPTGPAAKLLSHSDFPAQPVDHLWHYTFDELVAFGQSNGQKRVAPAEIERRRTELGRNRQQPTPPELIWYDPETQQWWPAQQAEVEELLQTSEVCLQGIGASAGSGPVEGITLVTNSAQEAAGRLLVISGPVVLVTQVTDPVWSSLFRRLTAVVTEMGGSDLARGDCGPREWDPRRGGGAGRHPLAPRWAASTRGRCPRYGRASVSILSQRYVAPEAVPLDLGGGVWYTTYCTKSRKEPEWTDLLCSPLGGLAEGVSHGSGRFGRQLGRRALLYKRPREPQDPPRTCRGGWCAGGFPCWLPACAS